MSFEVYLSAVQQSTPDVITRTNIGRTKIHIKLKGFFYAIFDLPDAIFDGDSKKYSEKWLAATCKSFTPHDRSLNKIDIDGMGGVQHSYITGQSLTRDITLTFYDYYGSPVYRTLDRWFSFIDPYTGLSTLKDYTPDMYKGTLMVIKTKPVGSANSALPDASKFTEWNESQIEHVWVYPGVFPSGSDGTNTLDDDIAGISEVQLSYTFSFDGYPLTEEYDNSLKKKAAELLNGLIKENNSIVADIFNWYTKNKAFSGTQLLDK